MKQHRDMHLGLRIERTDCDVVYVSGHTKCARYEHDKQDVLSIEWAGAVPMLFQVIQVIYSFPYEPFIS